MPDNSEPGNLVPKKKDELSKPSTDLIRRGLSLPAQPIPNQVSIYMESLLDHTFPGVRKHLPDRFYNVRHAFTLNPGKNTYCWTHSLCTHLDLIEIWFLFARGGKKFLETQLPETYFWFGTKYLERIETFLMMCRADRKFYFLDTQDKGWWHHESPSRHRLPEVQQQLKKALDLWESGNRYVIYSHDWGWLDPETTRFERDRSDPEYKPWVAYEDALRQKRIKPLSPPVMEIVSRDEDTLVNGPIIGPY
jgi:hypothetical protein